MSEYKLNGNVEPHKLTAEDRKKGQAQRLKNNAERRKLKQELEILLDKKIKDKTTGKRITTQEALCITLIHTALKGGKDSVKAYEVIRDTIGQAPKLQQEISMNSVNSVVLSEIDELMEQERDDGETGDS